MGLFDFLKGKSSSEHSRPVQRDVLNLQVNDIVTYDLEDYMVVGKLTYRDSGYEWYDYQLKGESKRIWLSAEMDDELEIAVYEKVKYTVANPVPEQIQMDGVTFELEEHGLAEIAHVSGQAGAVEGQKVEYWDFATKDDERYLSVEKWGNDWEVSRGYPVTEKELNILAGS